MPVKQTAWPHSPVHFLSDSGTFFVTAATHRHESFFAGADRLRVLHRGLLSQASEHGWHLEAWAVFSNHYHWIGHSPRAEVTANSLRSMLQTLHEKTAKWVNRLDQTPNRKVWFNYWETRLTFDRSYRTRLKYVHENAVKHGLVTVARDYPWCSAAWFERTASAAMVRAIYSMKTDRLNLRDDMPVSADW